MSNVLVVGGSFASSNKNISPGVEKKYVSHLSNHLGPEDAKETAELFEEYLQKTSNIKALLNK